MLTRINILAIIRDHFSTLRKLDSRTANMSIEDFLLFFLSPALIAFMLVVFGIKLDSQVSNLIAAVSIFGGFLFNLLAIIYSQFDKIKVDSLTGTDSRVKKRFVKEIHSNISYCIVLSIIIVIMLMLSSVSWKSDGWMLLVSSIIDGVTYFLLITFILTLLMIINRIYILLKKDSME